MMNVTAICGTITARTRKSLLSIEKNSERGILNIIRITSEGKKMGSD
jgi:hypothetical protein